MIKPWINYTFKLSYCLNNNFFYNKVPKVYWDYCSDRVLTMEYCEGIRVDDLEQMKKSKINVNKVC